MEESEKTMKNGINIWALLAGLAAVAILSAFWATYMAWTPFSPRVPPVPYSEPWDLELFYIIKTVVSTVNVTILIFLLAIYVGIFRKTRSEFTIGLMIFSLVLLLNALSSNPFVIWAFGFKLFGLGPFAMLPDIFTLAALSVLLYLSSK